MEDRIEGTANSEALAETPAFARGGTELTTELRGECPRWIVEVIDAVALARGGPGANIHRATIVNEVLAEWAEKKRHEAMLVHRIAGFNPTGSDSGMQALRVVDMDRKAR
jgi:hypothetical protein